MRATHAGSFADHQLSALIDMCERPIANTALEKCPLCLQENQPLKSHLARHLQTLALFTLPRRDSESDDDMASIGAHVWHSDDEEDDQRMEGMGDVESGSEISSAGMREIPDVVDEEANRGLARDEISQRLLSKVTPGTNSQQAALDVEKWTEEEKRAFMLSWGVNPSVDPEVAVALVQSWEETTRKKEEEEEEEVEEGSRAKKPVPEIDFTLHTMDDGTLVSAAPEDAQTAICKELIGIITKDSGFWTLEQKKRNAALDIESWSDAQKVQFQSTFGVDPVASPETAVALVLGWEKTSRRKAKEKKATDEGGEKNEQTAEETSKDVESSKDKIDVDGESEKAKQERARDEFFKRLGSKIRQQQPREGREGTYLLQVESLSEEEIKQFELFSGFNPRHDPKVAFELAQIYEEDALRRGKVEKAELVLGREEEKTVNGQGQPSLGATFADDPTSLWPLSRVLEWLEENGFSELWRETFKDLGLQGAGFLGLGDVGNTHSVVFPQLAKVCARRGVEWNETKEQEEANRMRDLIWLFKGGKQERELKDRFFQLRRAEDVVDGDFEEKKANSAEVETRKKSLDEVMSRVRRDVEKAGLPPWLFRKWEMERLKEDYMILQGMDAQVDMDFNEREKAFQFRMTRLKNSMRVAALPLILLAEWDKELGKPEEVEPLGVESAMKRFKDDYRKLAALEEREKQIEKRTGEGKIEYDLRVLIRSMSDSGLPLSLLKEWTRELGTPHSLSKIVDLEIERIEGVEIVERERAEERKGYELFVGNLFPDVDEFLLMSTFDSRYSSCMSASVREDPNARQNYGADRNCGVVRFSSESDKQRALYEMQDAYCGSTPMRLSTYPPECWLDDSPDAPDRSHRLNVSAPADMEGAVPNSKDPARQFLSVPGGPITPTMEPEMDKRAASPPAGPDPQFPPPSSQATGNMRGTTSYDGRQGANSYETMKSTLSTSTSSIPGVEDIPSFSPFPKLVNTPTNIPPSDEEKEILLEKARIPVLHSDDPEMQLAWAQDALTWVEIAQNDGNRISKRPSTPRNERCIRKDAIAIVTFLAEQSHPKAMFMKGIWHEFGKFGYRVDKKEAFLHMRTAAEKGYSRAYYRMGMAYEQSNDAPKAIEMYWRGVSFDDSAACYRMGMMLILGQQGITQDYEEGMKLLYKAAETADENAPQGAYVLGMLQIKELPQVQVPEMYLRVSANIGKSYIEKAAFLGFSKAQARMGQAYELAQLDCEFDPTTSLHYYVLAARQGEPEAEMSVSKWFLCGYEGIFDKSPELAFEYAQRAAGAEYALAEFALGYFYEVGVYVSIDMQNARLWYEKAAAKGNQDAIARLDSIRRAPEFADLERQNSSLSLAQESSVYQSVYQPRLQMPMPGKIPNITRAELPANRAYREAPDVNPASLSSFQPQPPPQFSSQSQNRQNSFSLAQESSVYQSIYEPRLQMPMPGKIPNITRAELPANQVYELPANQVYREAPDVNPASLSSFQPQPPQFSSQSQKRHQGANTHFGGGESAGSPQSRTGALEASTRTGIGMGPPKPGDSNKDTPTAKKKEKERGFGRLRKFISRGKSPPPVA
jgi:TPR repeat protein